MTLKGRQRKKMRDRGPVPVSVPGGNYPEAAEGQSSGSSWDVSNTCQVDAEVAAHLDATCRAHQAQIDREACQQAPAVTRAPAPIRTSVLKPAIKQRRQPTVAAPATSYQHRKRGCKKKVRKAPGLPRLPPQELYTRSAASRDRPVMADDDAKAAAAGKAAAAERLRAEARVRLSATRPKAKGKTHAMQMEYARREAQAGVKRQLKAARQGTPQGVACGSKVAEVKETRGACQSLQSGDRWDAKRQKMAHGAAAPPPARAKPGGGTADELLHKQHLHEQQLATQVKVKSLSTGDPPVPDGSTAAAAVLCEVGGCLLTFSADAGDSQVTRCAAPLPAAADREEGPPAPAAHGHSDHSSSDGDYDDPAADSCGEVGENVRRPALGFATVGASAGGTIVERSTAGAAAAPPTSFAVHQSRDLDLKCNEDAEETGRICAAGGTLGRFERGGPRRALSPAGEPGFGQEVPPRTRFAAVGSTMNRASRMESTCRPGSIHACALTASMLLLERQESSGGVILKVAPVISAASDAQRSANCAVLRLDWGAASCSGSASSPRGGGATEPSTRKSVSGSTDLGRIPLSFASSAFSHYNAQYGASASASCMGMVELVGGGANNAVALAAATPGAASAESACVWQDDGGSRSPALLVEHNLPCNPHNLMPKLMLDYAVLAKSRAWWLLQRGVLHKCEAMLRSGSARAAGLAVASLWLEDRTREVTRITLVEWPAAQCEASLRQLAARHTGVVISRWLKLKVDGAVLPEDPMAFIILQDGQTLEASLRACGGVQGFRDVRLQYGKVGEVQSAFDFSDCAKLLAAIKEEALNAGHTAGQVTILQDGGPSLVVKPATWTKVTAWLDAHDELFTVHVTILTAGAPPLKSKKRKAEVVEPLPCNPSDFGKHLFKYRDQQYIAMDRPTRHQPPSVLPVEMMFQPFAKFQDDLQAAVPSAECDRVTAEVVRVMSCFYVNESVRAPKVRKVVKRIAALADVKIATEPTEHGAPASDGDGLVLIGQVTYSSQRVEVKNEIGSSGDAWPQLAAYQHKVLEKVSRTSRCQVYPAPTVCIEAHGTHLRVIACCWAGPGSTAFVRAAAVTPLVPFQEQGAAHLERCSKMVSATSQLLHRTSEHYKTVETSGRPELPWARIPHDVGPGEVPAPWPLLQLLQEGYISTVRHFTGAGPRMMYLGDCKDRLGAKTTVVVKLLERTGEYGGYEAQMAWAKHGAAPTPQLHRSLGAGFHMLVYKHAPAAEGWRNAWDVANDAELAEVQTAALVKLKAVKDDTSSSHVNGDCRRGNGLWRRLEDGTVEVVFVDFDWGGPAGTATYPGFIHPRAFSHAPFVVPRQLIATDHDEELVRLWPSEERKVMQDTEEDAEEEEGAEGEEEEAAT